MNTVFRKFSELIMIEQTIFALPFAYTGILFAGGAPLRVWVLVTLALFGARTAGMSFNRVLDADIDARNPRTSDRHIPAGKVTRFQAWALGAAASSLLVLSAWMLNPLCFVLSFPAAAMLLTYSLFKRFSSASHFYLGLVEAAAPIGGYLAVKGSFDLTPFFPGAAIMFWIAGFDILYALADEEFDRREGLHSVPAALGRKGALAVSAACHAVSVAALMLGGLYLKASPVYYAAAAAVAAVFVLQHYRTRRKSGDERAIFRLNRLVGPLIFAGAAASSL